MSRHKIYEFLKITKHVGLCPNAVDPKCRLIKRGNPKRREWTCTVLVHNPLLIGCFTLTPYRVEHLDYCVSTLRPSLSLRSLDYDMSKKLGRNVSSSEGGTTPKPVYMPEDDDFEDDIL
ncbi:unnamed protein product [Bemisia tabaci]|uniref:Uncharacterized protein n=1 Tax=Bemisia tabaci TaxID=7038 RepID=A0A9P0AEF1_BEMTA|nr:unnamed protein product [Bemisia tabaci]